MWKNQNIVAPVIQDNGSPKNQRNNAEREEQTCCPLHNAMMRYDDKTMLVIHR